MARIDRTEQEKTVQIGPWKIKMGTICILGLVIIMVGSSFGYIASELNKPEEQQQNENLIQAQVFIVFDENNTIDRIESIEKGKTAEQLIKKVANVTTFDSANGKIITSVTSENLTKTNTNESQWFIYINGKLSLRGFEKYVVNHADQIIVKYEVNLFI